MDLRVKTIDSKEKITIEIIKIRYYEQKILFSFRNVKNVIYVRLNFWRTFYFFIANYVNN